MLIDGADGRVTRAPALGISGIALREYCEGDLPALYAYQSDPRFRAHYGEASWTEADCRALMSKFLAWQHEAPRTRYQFAIVETQGGVLIGSVGLRGEADPPRTAVIGCELAATHWGRGIATAAGRAMIAFGFQRLEFDRIQSDTMAANAAARRVLERCGLRFVRNLEPIHGPDGTVFPRVLYAADRSQYSG